MTFRLVIAFHDREFWKEMPFHLPRKTWLEFDNWPLLRDGFEDMFVVNSVCYNIETDVLESGVYFTSEFDSDADVVSLGRFLLSHGFQQKGGAK